MDQNCALCKNLKHDVSLRRCRNLVFTPNLDCDNFKEKDIRAETKYKVLEKLYGDEDEKKI